MPDLPPASLKRGSVRLAAHLLREIMVRGSAGGPLFPLASQLNDDLTHLQVRVFKAYLVPGLLQTGDYARAVTSIGHPDAPERELDRRTGMRLARQAVLSRPDPPYLWVVLDEATLRRPIGGPHIMRAQIRHLIAMTERPDVTVQIIPFAAGGHSGASGPFSILRFAEPDLPDVVYLEQLTSALYLDQKETVDSYMMVMDRLCSDALTPSRSIEVLRDALRQL